MTGYRIKWNDKWIAKNYLRYPSYKAMVEDHNKLFGTDAKGVSLKAHAMKMGIKKPQWYDEYTDEQKEWLKEFYPKHGVKETQREFNEKFNADKTISAIKQAGLKYAGFVDNDVATANKTRACHAEGSKRAIKKAGDTRIECGRLVMKADDGKWKSATRVVYESNYGEIPRGYVVTALDGNNENIELDNLVSIPLKYLGLLQKYGLRSENIEITRTGILWCDLYTELNKNAKAQFKFF